jgi:hypothetical protein
MGTMRSFSLQTSVSMGKPFSIAWTTFLTPSTKNVRR